MLQENIYQHEKNVLDIQLSEKAGCTILFDKCYYYLHSHLYGKLLRGSITTTWVISERCDYNYFCFICLLFFSVFFHVFQIRKKKISPDSCQLGAGLPLIARSQCSTEEHKPFHTFICDHETERQTQDSSLNTPECRQKQKHWANHKQSSTRDCNFFAIHNISPLCSFLEESY